MQARLNPQTLTPEQLHAARGRPNENKMVLKGCAAVVYINRTRGRPCARGYVGKSLKKSFAYSFIDETQMMKFIADFHNTQRARTEATAARKAERVAFRHTLAVGDVLYCSWGYEQTNVDFYQVTALCGDHQIEAREIEGECISSDGNWTGRSAQRIICADFTATLASDHQKYDVILMNPPFANGSDISHINHARKFLKPGGRIVAICANGPRQNAALKPIADTWRELPAGTFAGTNVNTALLTING